MIPKHLKGWQYKEDAPHDVKYLKDRRKLFALSGNGWWWDPYNYTKLKENLNGQ